MNNKKIFLPIFILFQLLPGKSAADPLPYQPVATPFADTVDQLPRDSANIKIGRVRINQAGYRPSDEKYFYYIGTNASDFKVIDIKTGNVAGQGTLTNTGKTTASSMYIRASNNTQIIPNGDTKYELTGSEVSGTVFEGKIPDLPEGEYKVVVGSDESGPFVINENTYAWVRDALIKFYGVNRCGDSESWFHDKCHIKDGPNGDGSLSGGWHDCGDHIKESQTMSFTMVILALAASALQDRDTDKYGRNHAKTVFTDGIPDILYELRHGADFVRNSYRQANGNVSNMYTSVGNFGEDHAWWGRPEAQDKMPKAQGGPVREVRKELWSTVLGRFAAGMAVFGKLYDKYDSSYAAESITIAKDLYAYGKENQTTGSSPAYNGENSYNDDMGLAAIALLWATRDTMYKYDLLYNTLIGANGNPSFPKGTFAGGWFACGNASPQHGLANTDWASTHTPALWALYKLILRDESSAALYGIDKDERLNLIEDVIYAIIVNIGDAGKGDMSITLPQHSLGWKSHILKYDGLWKTMHTQQEWVWNRCQAGNITELFCYYDIAKDIQGTALPNTPATEDWKAGEVKRVMVQQLDYMLGVNPWDVSMICGVGNKNFNHPHHRTANPEGKNFPGLFYRYRPPVGALHGGYDPTGNGDYKEHFSDYFHSETGIDATTNILLPVVGLGKDISGQSPYIYVHIVYVDHEKAIVEVRQSFFGAATIRYGVAPSASDFTAPCDSASIFHVFNLTGLQPRTTYNFDVLVSDVFGNDTIVMDWVDGKQEYFSFTTLSTGPDDAIIENVKVCRVTHDSVEIFWHTPNGKFNSRVVYGTQKPPSTVHDGDIAGMPVYSHYVKIGGLQERTTYYFYVQSGTTIDDNNGKYYTFTTTVEHVDFDIRALQYDAGGLTALGINFVNQDKKSYDSLELRLYIHGTEQEVEDFAARVDIGIKYSSAGFQDEHFKDVVDGPLQKQKPQKMADTFNPADNTWHWYLTIPLGDAEMESGARFRLDLVFVKRNLPWNDDLLNIPPTHAVGGNDWSWAPHSRPKDPVDFGGIPIGKKEDVDNNYWNTEIDRYITVYRKSQFVWGYSPSPSEQSNKVNYYEMTTQITSPLNNPSEVGVTITSSDPVIQIKGWAQISEDGVMEDIWVNGKDVDNLSTVVSHDSATNLWNFDIPVTLSGVNNTIDITFFAGPPNPSDSCQGCASTTHRFFIKFSGCEEATMFLTDTVGALLPDTVQIDTTLFHIFVVDKSGDKDPSKPEMLTATVFNPIKGDTIVVQLVETGNSTDTFSNTQPIAVVNKPPSQTNDHEIAMGGGDSVIVYYEDPSDSTDTETIVLYARTPIPVPVYGWYKDIDGNDAVDQAMVIYNMELESSFIPDSLCLHFPSENDSRTFSSGSFTVAGTMLTVNISPPFAEKTTGFTNSLSGTGQSYKTFQNTLYETGFTLYDSVGAVLKSAMLFNQPGSPTDSLFIIFSERMDATTLAGATLQLLKTGTTDTTVLNVLSVSGSSDNSSFNIAVSPIAGQTQRPEAGDSLRLVPGPQTVCVRDPSGNQPHENNPPVIIGIITTPPTIIAACYNDNNADGVIENAVLYFNKKVNVSQITNMAFEWFGELHTVPASEASQAGDTVVHVNLEGTVVPDTLIQTSGLMKLTLQYQNNVLAEVTLADSAAPVIVSATYVACQIMEKSGALNDTLHIRFSEEVEDITSPTPFLLNQYNPNEIQYHLVLDNSDNGGASHTFNVTDIAGVTYPLEDDSIWINSIEHVSDLDANVQSHSGNRRAPLTIKLSIEYTIIIRACPNPFTPGKTDIPASFISRSRNAISSDFKKGIAIEIKTEPLALLTLNKITLDASLHILDAVGNVVIKCKGLEDEQKDVILIRDQTTGKLYFLWNGRNKYRRMVGKGVYSALVKVVDNNGKNINEKVMIGVKYSPD